MSMLKDRYGNELSTTSMAARDAYLAGVDSLLAATPGMDAAFARSAEADEGFALAHISLARAKQLLGRGHEAKAPLARARELAAGATPREQSQIAIFEKILTGQAPAALEAIREHMMSSRSWNRSRSTMATTGGTARSLPSRRSSSANSTRAAATSRARSRRTRRAPTPRTSAATCSTNWASVRPGSPS
jgi:hypothetical protein